MIQQPHSWAYIQKRQKLLIQKDLCTLMFIAALFVIANVVLEKTLESPLDCKEIQPVHTKDQSWVFIGRTDVEAETPILGPPDAKS